MVEKIPLVLLPGVLNTEALWQYQIDALGDVAEISVGDLTSHETIADMAESVLEKAPDEFALAGLFLGGYTAQEIVRQAPERVTRLALLDTSARADTPGRGEGRKAQIALAQNGQFEEVVAQYVSTMLNPDAPPNQELQEAIRAMCLSNGPEVFIRQQKAIMRRPDGRADLTKIDCPTLVLCGRQDQPTPLEMHEELVAGIAEAILVVVEDCGHLAPLERPESVGAALRDWLSS